MASGNHVCNKNCADLPIAPTNKDKQIIVIKLASKNKKLIFLSLYTDTKSNTSINFIEPK